MRARTTFEKAAILAADCLVVLIGLLLAAPFVIMLIVPFVQLY